MTRTIKPVQFTHGFLLFWQQCLRKTGKQAAQRAWNTHGLELVAQKVADKMAHDVKTDFKKRDIGMVPHPSTWINAGCYDDEIEKPAHVRKHEEFMRKFKETGRTIEYW